MKLRRIRYPGSAKLSLPVTESARLRTSPHHRMSSEIANVGSLSSKLPASRLMPGIVPADVWLLLLSTLARRLPPTHSAMDGELTASLQAPPPPSFVRELAQRIAGLVDPDSHGF